MQHVPFRHPLASHPAGAILGHRTDGRPIYAIAGGSNEGTADSGGTPPAADTGTPPATPPAAPPAAAPNSDGTDWKAEARKWEQRAKENKTAAEQGRTAAEELAKLREQSMTEQEKAVSAAEKKGRAAAEAERDQALAERDAKIRKLAIRDAIRERADKGGAAAKSLIDSVSFNEAIAELDPSVKGFTTALDDAIKAAVKDNPALAATPVAPASGGDLSGGTGEASARQRPTSLSAAVRGSFGT
ncbi:hypothetical protein [Streptomyces xanthophaeus]|uniref:hypothetical protein n=1 Tax=Streptomyces xanthophaeus TaxID=67385 RepID=UPI002648B32C|nr:hypothetical protein [Streptomyces xanthophaeus]WKD36510.1 hypothetical protein KO717_34315 [Streptomyces xanthophaeus]